MHVCISVYVYIFCKYLFICIKGSDNGDICLSSLSLSLRSSAGGVSMLEHVSPVMKFPSMFPARAVADIWQGGREAVVVLAVGQHQLKMWRVREEGGEGQEMWSFTHNRWEVTTCQLVVQDGEREGERQRSITLYIGTEEGMVVQYRI